MDTQFGQTTFTYTKQQLEKLALHLRLEGNFECAIRASMQDDFLWPYLPAHDRAFHICYQLKKIEINGGEVDWPELSVETMIQVVKK